jgi:hypothetical protein
LARSPAAARSISRRAAERTRRLPAGRLTVAEFQDGAGGAYTPSWRHRSPRLATPDPALLAALRRRGRVRLALAIDAEGIAGLIAAGWLDRLLRRPGCHCQRSCRSGRRGLRRRSAASIAGSRRTRFARGRTRGALRRAPTGFLAGRYASLNGAALDHRVRLEMRPERVSPSGVARSDANRAGRPQRL